MKERKLSDVNWQGALNPKRTERNTMAGLHDVLVFGLFSVY